uniref:NADH-ubiquinone oxidoreductase chain 6 n=1 Tax=Galeopterus variegatus TaxID=482537 RepID=Q8HH96_GALVR|nr:NADH subunit 6 [Galeopterus variegatus]
MMYLTFLLSVIFVVGFVGFSSKPSPIYGGVGLLVSGGVGCGIVVSLGGSFLGLMVFLVYLGGMMVVFGYTTAMAIEEYPEAWGSNVVVLGASLLGLVMELLVVLWMVNYDEAEVVISFKNMGYWVIFEGEGTGYFHGDSTGVAALYSYGCWLVVVAGWSLFVGVVVVIEVVRGG